MAEFSGKVQRAHRGRYPLLDGHLLVTIRRGPRKPGGSRHASQARRLAPLFLRAFSPTRPYDPRMKPFDLQVNGYVGADFCSLDLTADQFHAACEAMDADGVGFHPGHRHHRHGRKFDRQTEKSGPLARGKLAGKASHRRISHRGPVPQRQCRIHRRPSAPRPCNPRA